MQLFYTKIDLSSSNYSFFYINASNIFCTSDCYLKQKKKIRAKTTLYFIFNESVTTYPLAKDHQDKRQQYII